MVGTGKALRDLTAADVMSRDLTLVPQEMSLQAAAHLLERAGVSGAPVVDQAGRCVGVLSTTDFVHFVGSLESDYRWPPGGSSERICEWQLVNGNASPKDTVGKHMTADPVTADPGTPIDALARRMLDAHIHRIVVLDSTGRPAGIVSSTDILAAVAYSDYA
jgi:CBS-domain-containing membrane protein